MTSSPDRSGVRLGHFELRQRLGAGGMGEVYLASDTRLGREVAVKLIPDSLANDAVRMARFEREARVLATLNHPNIAMIHGIEESDSQKALVMELVPGEDLSARLARGAMPVSEVLPAAIQIARALEAAHLKGIVHRDLKPGNIKVSPEGIVKVLDFGLAKEVEIEPASGRDLSRSPTISIHATQMGLILGTAAYMSPEQAKGQPVDARADVFSFGCVLFEMLAGERAFGGEDVTEVLASVIKRDIQWDRLPASVPYPLKKLIARCLEGRPDDRYQSIGDARIDLTNFLADPAALSPPAALAARRGLSWPVAAVLMLLALLAGVSLMQGLRPAKTLPAPPPLAKFRLPLRESTTVSLSPDGRAVASIQQGEVRVRRMDQLQDRTLDLPWEAMAMWQGPGWTRDSSQLILQDQARGDLWRVPVDGGEPRMITRLPAKGFLWGIAEQADGRVLIGLAEGGIHRAPLQGGELEAVIEAGKDESLAAPFVLPNGRDFLFAEVKAGRIESFDGRQRRTILQIPGARAFDPMYSPSGYIVFRREGDDMGIWAVPFSLNDMKTTGAPFRLLPTGWFSVSNDDTLAYVLVGTTDRPARLVWVNRRGTVGAGVGAAMPRLTAPVFSPDGRFVAVSARDDEAIAQQRFADIHVFDLASGSRYALRDDIGGDYRPYWGRDGRIGFLTYASGIRELRVRATDGTGSPETIGRAVLAGGSRDGRCFAFRYLDENLRYSIDGSPVQSSAISDEMASFALAPGCGAIAYTLSTGPGLFVKRFPDGTGLVAVTSEAASRPLWSADGRELYYWRGGMLMAVPFDAARDGAKPGPATALFPAGANRLAAGQYDVAPDGRFLMTQYTSEPAAAASQPPEIVVVQNWSAEYRRLP